MHMDAELFAVAVDSTATPGRINGACRQGSRLGRADIGPPWQEEMRK